MSTSITLLLFILSVIRGNNEITSLCPVVIVLSRAI